MGSQFKMALAEPKLGTARQVTATEPRPWDVSEDVRDKFRRVRSSVSMVNRQSSLCVAVCSTSRSEGVSWVTAMLGCAMAEENEAVLLIDANRAHPSQNRLFGLEQDLRTPNVQSEMVDVVSRRTSKFNISILMPEQDSPKGLEFGGSLHDALPKLRLKNNLILIDCEPLRESSQLLDLAPSIDGVIFVVEAEGEHREVVARNLESIKRAGLRVFGVILNKRKRYIPGWLYGAL